MTVIEDKTVSLLMSSSGIWDTGSEMEYALVGDIVKFAHYHAVDALVADAIVGGKVRLVGDKEKCAKWGTWVMGLASLQIQHEKTKQWFDKVLADFTMVMQKENIDFVVFKGPAVASLYTNPCARAMGDIDFYVPEWDYSRALETVQNVLGVSVNRCDVDKHDSFDFKGIHFEMHYQMETFGAMKHQKYFAKLVDDSIRAGRIRFFDTCEGVKVPALEPIVDIMLVFKHMMNHFIGEGVGLRQLTDFAVLQKTYEQDIDVEQLRLHLKNIGYLRAFDNMVDVTARYFHLQWREYEEKIECHDQELTERFMHDILKNGNFGRMDYKHRLGWRKRWETTQRFFSNIFHYFCLAPWDMTCMVTKRIFISVKAH